MNAEDRFWPKVEEHENYFGECWNWNGYKDKDGYGKFHLNGGQIGAYRFSYELFKGPIPEGLQIDHLCRNPSCVNPDHLEAVTCKVNLLRGNTFNAREAAQTHCIHGHPLSGHNLLPYGFKVGQRLCRQCWLDRKRRWREKRKSLGLKAY